MVGKMRTVVVDRDRERAAKFRLLKSILGPNSLSRLRFRDGKNIAQVYTLLTHTIVDYRLKLTQRWGRQISEIINTACPSAIVSRSQWGDLYYQHTKAPGSSG